MHLSWYLLHIYIWNNSQTIFWRIQLCLNVFIILLWKSENRTIKSNINLGNVELHSMWYIEYSFTNKKGGKKYASDSTWYSSQQKVFILWPCTLETDTRTLCVCLSCRVSTQIMVFYSLHNERFSKIMLS